MIYYTILYYTILYYTILYYTILYYTILYYTILYYTILYFNILYCTVLRVPCAASRRVHREGAGGHSSRRFPTSRLLGDYKHLSYPGPGSKHLPYIQVVGIYTISIICSRSSKLRYGNEGYFEPAELLF